MIPKPNTLELNLRLVEEFLLWKKSRANYPKVLGMFINELDKSIMNVDELDIQKFLESHHLKDSTWNVWLSILRQFYSWLINKEKHIPYTKWKPPEFFDLIENKRNKTQSIYGPADIWTEEEILIAIASLDHPRDKAMIAMLYDLAARPHELMKLKIKDVVLRENYAQVKLTDHTGERILPITLSFPYLLTWMNNHPLKEHLDAPLWVRLQKTPIKIGYPALYRLCTAVLKSRIGHKIHKPFNPYCMGDHSRLTNLVEQGVSEFELKRFRGWRLNSSMPTRYIHMSGKGLNEKLLDLAGIKKPEQVKESVLKQKECYRCKHKNAPDAKYCDRCNFVISTEGLDEILDREHSLKQEVQQLRHEVNKSKFYSELVFRYYILQMVKEQGRDYAYREVTHPERFIAKYFEWIKELLIQGEEWLDSCNGVQKDKPVLKDATLAGLMMEPEHCIAASYLCLLNPTIFMQRANDTKG